jgi:hypothetical protein
MAFNPFWEVVELNNVMKSDYRRSERTNRTAVSDGGSDTVKRTAFWAPERTASSGRPEADGGSGKKNWLGGRVLPSLRLLISYFD